MTEEQEVQPVPPGMVRIVHPEVGFADVVPSTVPAWEDSGWTLETPAEPPAEPAEESTPKKK